MKSIINPHSAKTDIKPTPTRMNEQNIDIKHWDPSVATLGGPFRYVLTIVIKITTKKQYMMKIINGVSGAQSR